MKKVFKYTGIVLLVIILLLFFIPIVFKSKIVTLVKREINKNIEASFFLHQLKFMLNNNLVNNRPEKPDRKKKV